MKLLSWLQVGPSSPPGCALELYIVSIPFHPCCFTCDASCHENAHRRTKPFNRLYSTKNTSTHQHLQRNTTTAWYETKHDLIPTCNTNDQAKQFDAARNQ